MKPVLPLRLATLLILTSAQSFGVIRAAPPEPPQIIAQKIYAEIRANPDPALTDALVDRYFDIHNMAIQALGASYRGFSAEQKAAYIHAFDTYFKKALHRVLSNHKDISISGLSSRVDGERAIVRCTVTSKGEEPVNLTLNLDAQQDSWKAYDVVVDDISLVLSYKPQFLSLYRQGGFDGLVAYLSSH